MVALYKKNRNSNTQETHGTFLEQDEHLEQYTYDDTTPETHMVTHQQESLPLDDIRTCIVDSGTSHTILKCRDYFTHIIPSHRSMTTITGSNQIEQGHGPAIITLPHGTTIHIKSAVYAPNATRNLISFKDIRENGYHIHTSKDKNQEVIHIVKNTSDGMLIKETLFAYPLGFYVTQLNAFHSNINDTSLYDLWHSRLGHPGMTMFQKMKRVTHGIPQNTRPTNLHQPCMACSQGKLILRPSVSKTIHEMPKFLERVHADVCGPIEPPSGPFRFFLIIIDASSKWSQVSLLSTRNMVFPRLLAHILKLKAQFPENPIKTIRVDNAGEFTSKTFEDFCMATGIDTQYPVPYVHFQNGIAESVIKRIQMIARPMLMQTQLPTTAWGHAVLHAASLLKYRPSAYNDQSPHHLAFGVDPDLSHVRIFGCQVLVPIMGPKRTKMGPQRQKGIYVGFESPSIIRYLEPTTADVFQARFTDCHFYENVFPILFEGKQQFEQPRKLELRWQTQSTIWNDPRTRQCEEEVRRILQLAKTVEQMPDAFTDIAQVTRSHIPAANAPARLQESTHLATDQPPRVKRGRPLGSKDTQPRQRRNATTTSPIIPEMIPTPSPAEIPENDEISIHYMNTGTIWNRNNIQMNDNFAFHISQNITNVQPDPKTITEAQESPDWSEWEKAINSELDSLIKRQVFGPIVPAPPDTHLTDYRWTFVKKRNAQGEVARYKARLVAKGYTQIPGRDFDLTYAPVMDAITYRYLVGFSLGHRLMMHQMDVVTAYLYGLLDSTIYMKAPPELIKRQRYHIKGEHIQTRKDPITFTSQPFTTKRPPEERTGHGPIVPEILRSGPIVPQALRSGTIVLPRSGPFVPPRHKSISLAKNGYAVQIMRSLYGLKRSGRMWYQRFRDEMLTMGFTNEDIAPCLFIKKHDDEFLIIAIYVDDINLFGHMTLLRNTIEILKRVFEMKDLGQLITVWAYSLNTYLMVYSYTRAPTPLKSSNSSTCTNHIPLLLPWK